MSLCRCPLLIVLLLLDENFRPFFDLSEPSGDLLCGLAPPFDFEAKRLKVLLKVLHPVPLLSPRVAITPEHLPKRYPPRRALSPRVCHEAREQYPSSAYRRLNALGVFLRSAVSYDRMWYSRIRFRQPGNPRRNWWRTFRSLSWSALLGLHRTVASIEPRLSASGRSGVNAHSDRHRFSSYTVRRTPMPPRFDPLP